MTKPILLSGIQPSGQLMIGHYLGVLKQWIHLQKDYQCFYPLVDLHAITVRQTPKLLNQRCYEFVALYLACGLDPQKSVIFIQSHVPQHAQCAWLLNCFTYIGELNRMTQFKDKSQKHAQNINAGLYLYPVLMAADILIYQADLVPVGEDQKQHLELCRNLAERINSEYPEKGQVFKVPEPFIPPKQAGGRIMSLQDPKQKMSKSDANLNSTLFLLDDDQTIIKKIKKSVTDSGSEISYDVENKPGVANLLTMFSLMSNESINQIVERYQGKSYGHLKVDLAEAMVEYLKPLKKQYQTIISDKGEMDNILKNGAIQAQEVAQKSVDKLSKTIGFIVE